MKFLYEFEKPIQGFGMERDPRIKEVKEKRNILEDYAKIFDVRISQVSFVKSLEELESCTSKNIIYMGIRGQEVSQDTAENTKIPRGIYVDQVEGDSPAMEAGIQTGDVITAFNKEDVRTMQRFYTELQKCQKEQKVKITIMRRGADGYGETQVTVTLDVR